MALPISFQGNNEIDLNKSSENNVKIVLNSLNNRDNRDG